MHMFERKRGAGNEHAGLKGISSREEMSWGFGVQDGAQVCSSTKRWQRWRWRNSGASHIAEKFILCFQTCSWSIIYMTGKQPIDYNVSF